MTTAVAVNPHEGEVAIAWSKAPGGVIVGRLSNRAIRWIEESVGAPFDELWSRVFSGAVRRSNGLSVTETTVVIWAAVEDHRRRTAASGAEFTIDDADLVVEEVGVNAAYQRATTLMLLACRDRLERWEAKAKAAGEPNPVDPLLAAARAAHGLTSSGPRSASDSPTTSTGD